MSNGAEGRRNGVAGENAVQLLNRKVVKREQLLAFLDQACDGIRILDLVRRFERFVFAFRVGFRRGLSDGLQVALGACLR